MGERLEQFREQVLTVPNAITATRLVLSPLFAKRLHDDPVGRWKETAAFMMTDNLDGFAAKIGDHSELLAGLGFRKSEVGRKGDPFTDVIVGSEMIVAGMRNGVIPKWLGGAALAQKALKSYHAVQAERQGAEVHVTDFGRHMEGVTNVSIGLLFPGEGIENEEQRRNYRQKCIAGAVAGITGAFLADRGYAAQARRQLGKA